MSVFQDLYDSEINFHISTMWDGGFDVKIGDEMNGYKAEATFERFGVIEYWIISRVLELYPDSRFSHAYKTEVEYAKSGIHPNMAYPNEMFMRIRATGDVGAVTDGKIEDGKVWRKIAGGWYEYGDLKVLCYDEMKQLNVLIKRDDAPEDPGINL